MKQSKLLFYTHIVISAGESHNHATTYMLTTKILSSFVTRYMLHDSGKKPEKADKFAYSDQGKNEVIVLNSDAIVFLGDAHTNFTFIIIVFS